MRLYEIPNDLDIDTKVIAFLTRLTAGDIDILERLIHEKSKQETDYDENTNVSNAAKSH